MRVGTPIVRQVAGWNIFWPSSYQSLVDTDGIPRFVGLHKDTVVVSMLFYNDGSVDLMCQSGWRIQINPDEKKIIINEPKLS